MLVDFSKTLLVLAPLAGYTDLPFRGVVKKFGADLTVSEMISSNALIYNNQKTLQLTKKSKYEEPYSLQISGNSVDIIKGAVEIINSIDGIDVIDLNSGCPSPKVVTHGSGSALLKDLNKLTKMIQAIKSTSNKKQTSVKVRIGFNDKNPVDIAKAVEAGGADYIAVHGRTRKGAYKEVVDYDAIRDIKKAINIPVIANGDITDLKKANYVLEHTGADGLMIGRGAVGKPWIFWQLSNKSEYVPIDIKKKIILEHYDSMIEFYGAHGIKIFRKHLHGYSKGFDGASEFRSKINFLEDEGDLRDMIDNFFTKSQ